MASRRSEGVGLALVDALACRNALVCARYLERNGKGKVGALSAVRAPKIPRTLPKPLTATSAKRLVDTDLRAGEEREPWVLARDAAVLALLYGSACVFPRRWDSPMRLMQAPAKGDVIIVRGKGNKTRMVPVLPQVLQAIADYVALCPYHLPDQGPIFVGARGGPLSPRILQLTMARLRGAFSLPKPRRRMRCGTPSPRTSWRAAATCVRSRNCWPRFALDHADLYGG